jgi:hypothetical protein
MLAFATPIIHFYMMILTVIIHFYMLISVWSKGFFFFQEKKKMGYLISPPIRRQSVWTHACFTLLEVLCIKFLPLSNINMNN